METLKMGDIRHSLNAGLVIHVLTYSPLYNLGKGHMATCSNLVMTFSQRVTSEFHISVVILYQYTYLFLKRKQTCLVFQ